MTATNLITTPAEPLKIRGPVAVVLEVRVDVLFFRDNTYTHSYIHTYIHSITSTST